MGQGFCPNPSCLIPHPSLPHLSSLIPHPSSLIPHPSSLIPHPSSLIPHPSSLIPHPSSLIPHPSSLIPSATRHEGATDHVELANLRSKRRGSGEVRDRSRSWPRTSAGSCCTMPWSCTKRIGGKARRRPRPERKWRASSKKMYRQKGTGNARAGTRRSGMRRGGGHIKAKQPARLVVPAAEEGPAAGHADGGRQPAVRTTK